MKHDTMKDMLREIRDARLNGNTPVSQFLRFVVVGIINTLVTLIVIFVCKSVLGVDEYVSNALGYVAGVINSFVWNRQWVFHSRGKMHHEMLRFFIGFGICYSIQFAIVWGLTHTPWGDTEYDLGFFVISGYGIATLIGTCAYTVSNFIYNRVFAFKTK